MFKKKLSPSKAGSTSASITELLTETSTQLPNESSSLLNLVASAAPASLTSQLTSANAQSSLLFLQTQLNSVKQQSTNGPLPLRLLASMGGLAMTVQSFLSVLGRFFTFSWVAMCVSIYTGLFGVVIVTMELGNSNLFAGYTKPLKTYLSTNLLLLTYTSGRGIFYTFAGSLMFSQFTLFEIIIGGFMMFVGLTCYCVGQSTTRKLNELRQTLSSESVVRSKFNEFDLDHNGGLESKELAQLCLSLGSPLTHDELVACLKLMDCDDDGLVSFEEFMGWWVGWKDEKEDLNGVSGGGSVEEWVSLKV